VPGFDITSILDFQPPRLICPACRALLRSIEFNHKVRPTSYWCPVCEVKFVADPKDSEDPWELGYYEAFRAQGWAVDHKGLFTHATALAEVVRRSRGARWPTMRTFFEVIARAKYFVHFTSWDISHIWIGALKMASVRVPVYGFASYVDPNTRAELMEYPREAPT